MPWRVFFVFQRFSSRIITSGVKKDILEGRRIQQVSIMPYYAVARGRSVGIYESWADCEQQVKGFSGARYKKFDSPQSAQDFINTEGGTSKPKTNHYNYKVQNHAGPSNNNLKRNYSTSTISSYNSSKQKPSKSKKQEESDSDSDDLSDMIIKQMDDIEKRVNSFSKGLDKIMHKGSGRKTIMIDPPEPKKKKSNGSEFSLDDEGYVVVYTDGACSSNGRAGAMAGFGVFWGDGHPLNTSQPVSGRATNNCGEIQASSWAMKQAKQNGIHKLAIYTDSKFLINAVTMWMKGWMKRGWKLASGEPVKNEVDFKELDRAQQGLQIKWIYVEAHKGIHGNEMADQLARAGAALYDRKD